MMKFIGQFLTNSYSIVLLMLVVVAWSVVQSTSYVGATIGMMVFSLLSTLGYMVLGAPDVAITEAAINACASTALIMCAGYITRFDLGEKQRCPYIIILVFLTCTITLCIIVGNAFPQFGMSTSPVAVRGQIYTANTVRIMHFPNMVTAILASFRGYDTLWETVVIFAALVAVSGILRANNASPR